MICLDFLNVVRRSYQHIRFDQLDPMPLLCDHQGLTCTPEDPNRSVDMKEIGLLFLISKHIEVSTKSFEQVLLRNRLKTAYMILYLNQMNCMN